MRYLYDTYKLLYPQYFTLEESCHYSDYRIDKAFDFDFSANSYWISHDPTIYFIIICFPFNFLTIESFEITTTKGGCRPAQFSVEVSVDGRNFVGNQEYVYTMNPGETKQFFMIITELMSGALNSYQSNPHVSHLQAQI